MARSCWDGAEHSCSSDASPFRRDDQELKSALLIGLVVWLAVEAAASAWFDVWFNVGVDMAVMVLFAVPLLRR